jgi:membrane carboxypeptidase/penicillin-binding protein
VDPRGGYAKEHLRQQFRDRFGGDHPPDWEVRTTFVPALQEAAERAVSEGLRRFHQNGLQAALVVVDPETGDLLALVGGRDFRQSQFNRATRSRRQPGSAFKPFLFAAALEQGYSPLSTLKGLATIAPQGPDEWAPRNASGETPDEITIREAIVESNNRAATVLQQRMGSRPLLRLASDVGMRDLPDVPSLSLGSGVGVRGLPEWRLRGPSPVDQTGDQRRRRRRGGERGHPRPCDLGAGRVSDGVDAERRDRPRHGVRRPELGSAFRGSGEDRHDE